MSNDEDSYILFQTWKEVSEKTHPKDGCLRSPSSLVVSGHKSPRSSWSRSQKRLYQRVLSGFECAKKGRDFVRVMTLTTAAGGPNDIHSSFEMLKKRIRRQFGRFEYVAVKEHTKEGLIHLHLVYRGQFIPQTWLSQNWYDVYRARVVWIAKLYSWKFAKHLARYFIKEGFGRYWMSWGWVYRGFVKDWQIIVSRYRDNAVKVWKELLYHGRFVKIGFRFELHAPWISQQHL